MRLEFDHIHCDFDCNCIWQYWVPRETCHFWKVKSTQQGYLQLGYEKPWHEAAALTMGVALASLKGQQLCWIIHIESWNHCNGWCLECQGSWLHAEPRKYRWQLLDREWRGHLWEGCLWCQVMGVQMAASQACSFRWLTSWVGISNLGDGENLQAMFWGRRCKWIFDAWYLRPREAQKAGRVCSRCASSSVWLTFDYK